jgi:positive regulator of sigma E activity
LLGSTSGEKQIEAYASADLGIRRGDTVRIVLEPQNVFKAAMIVYGYPLLGALIAAGAAYAAGLGDLAAAVSALTGIAAGFSVARFRLSRARCLRDFTPVVAERLGTVAD